MRAADRSLRIDSFCCHCILALVTSEVQSEAEKARDGARCESVRVCVYPLRPRFSSVDSRHRFDMSLFC